MRKSDPAAGPELPEALLRARRRTASSRVIARTFEADLSAPVVAAGTRIQNVRQISERVAMGRALWRELVVGFAHQLGELNLGFTQLAALYVLAEGSTTTVADLADAIGRSPSATSRLVDGLVKRRLVERRREDDDGRLRTVWLTPRGQAVLRMVDRARAEQFLSAVRPLPRGERALIAMGVAALATHAISRRGRLVRGARAPERPHRAVGRRAQSTLTRSAATRMPDGPVGRSSCSTAIEHRHEDGSWSEMVEERRPHDAADHDAERSWGLRRIFRCQNATSG